MGERVVFDCMIFLDLMDEQTSDGRKFRQEFPDLQILDPHAFVVEISPSKPEP